MNLLKYEPADYFKMDIPDFFEYTSIDPEIINPYSDLNLGIQQDMDEYQYDEQEQDVSIDRSDTKKYIKSVLMQQYDLSNEQASALTGVWYAESNLKPHIHEIGKESNHYAGQGIVQWTGKQRQQHARDIYKRIYGKDKQIKQMTLDEQINVAVAEFKERTGNWQRFLNAKNLNEAVDIVWRGYENGGTNQLASMAQMRNVYRGNADKQLRDRLRFSREIFNL